MDVVDVQKFVTIRLAVSFPHMRNFAHQKCLLDCFFPFLHFSVFYARVSILTRDIDIAVLSVCLSVRHVSVFYTETA